MEKCVKCHFPPFREEWKEKGVSVTILLFVNIFDAAISIVLPSCNSRLLPYSEKKEAESCLIFALVIQRNYMELCRKAEETTGWIFLSIEICCIIAPRAALICASQKLRPQRFMFDFMPIPSPPSSGFYRSSLTAAIKQCFADLCQSLPPLRFGRFIFSFFLSFSLSLWLALAG